MRWPAALIVVFVASTAVLSANWPAWRGPTGDGVSGEQNLPVKWSPSENIAWKLALPQWSGATPVIWGDMVFLNVAEADGNHLSLWAVNRTTGTVLWKRPLSTGNNKQRKQNMSSPSPVTDGGTVWAITGTGILKAFDFKGVELWTRDIQKDYGRFGLNWGYANSPLLHENDLFVPVLHGMKTDDPSYMLRINGKTGATKWRVERPTKAIRESPDAYITPALARVGAGHEVILNGADVVTGHDPATGRELWRADGLNPDNDPSYRIVATPVTYGDVYHQNEVEQSAYNFEHSNVDFLLQAFAAHETQAKYLVEQELALPAYEQVLKTAHTFNLLDARGAISVTERAAYIARIRDLARSVALSYYESRKRLGFPMAPRAWAEPLLEKIA